MGRDAPIFKQKARQGTMGYERCIAARVKGGRGSGYPWTHITPSDEVLRAKAPRGA